MGYYFDLFISYASEDKKDFVRPLAYRFLESGYFIWYDEFVLRLGDSLTERIDHGLANTKAGLFVLSPAFMQKPWPKRELAGLTARHINEATRLFPIWHNIELSDVLRFSPPLADIKALNSSDGIDTIVREVSRVVAPTRSSFVDATIELAQDLFDRGHHELAMKTAFVAFDRRVMQLVEQYKEKGVIPPDYRMDQYAGSAWEAISTLQPLGCFTVPASVDLNYLEKEMESTIGRWSSFASTVPTPERAWIVVSNIAAILRANPLLS